MAKLFENGYAAAFTAVERGGVLTAAQLRRHHRLGLKDVRDDLHIFRSVVTATSNGTRTHTVTFVAKEASYILVSAALLRHLAGVAEMRFQLGARCDRWQRFQGREPERAEPDALWSHGNAQVAVEFDAGSYPKKRVAAKLHAFGRYSEQVWGAASTKRLDFLRQVAQEERVAVTLVHSPWL